MSAIKNTVKTILGIGLPAPAIVRPVIRGFYYAGVIITESLIFMRKALWVEPVLRSVCAEVGRKLRADRLPYIRGKGCLRIGSEVNLSGRSSFYFMSNMPVKPVIEIGNNVFIGNGCTFSAASRIAVGDGAFISAGVRICDNDGHPLDAVRRMAGDPIRPDEVKPVTIEAGGWIGASAIILKGVTIGRGAVVGAGSVVTRDVPADTVVAGNPAVIVKSC
jgi:acetyltransferase-like isoleucine patch superfamily enzyme